MTASWRSTFVVSAQSSSFILVQGSTEVVAGIQAQAVILTHSKYYVGWNYNLRRTNDRERWQ